MRRLCLPVSFVLLAISCHEPTDTSFDHDLSAIMVSARVEPNAVVAGNSVDVQLTLRNSANRAIEISQCPIYFWVQDFAGTVVGGSKLLYCVAGTFVYMPLRFAPLETKTLTFTWSGQETQSVPPGSYFAAGWVNDPERHSSLVPLTVQSAP